MRPRIIAIVRKIQFGRTGVPFFFAQGDNYKMYWGHSVNILRGELREGITIEATVIPKKATGKYDQLVEIICHNRPAEELEAAKRKETKC